MATTVRSIARYGPFVMNTRAELLQAVDDFQRPDGTDQLTAIATG